MRILIDESLPRRLKQEFSGHQVATVPEMGWASKTNGELLSLAIGEFDVLVTADQNLQHQQNLEQAEISVLVMAARTNRFEDLNPLVPRALTALESIQPGDVVRITA